MYKFMTKITSTALMSAAAVVMSAGVAQAALIDQYLDANGANTLEDDSNEYVFRDNEIITSGDIMEGDILLQVLDFSIIGGVNIDSDGNELTAVALNVVTNINNPRSVDPDGGGGPLLAYDAVDFDMVAATAADWLALTNVDITSLGFDETGLISLLYEDAANNLDVFTQMLGTSLPNVLDGDLVMALGLDDATDFITAVAVPEDIITFSPLTDPNSVPGVSIYGGFSYELSFLFEDVAGNTVTDMGGSGNNLITDRPLIAAVIDDTQARFTLETVPEPATLGLLGLGFLGFGASRHFGKRRS
jgi:hypothetical protein